MRDKLALILLQVVSSLVIGFAICFGLGLLLKLWEMPTGSSLTILQVKDVMITAIVFSIGMTMGEYTRRKWQKRSKPSE
jgi:uncharacterized membrane protein